MAEFFMQKGKHVPIIYDDLSKHRGLLPRHVPVAEASSGREALPRRRLLHPLPPAGARRSSLDEKAAVPITALPIIETQAGDVSAYIPTNVISITDGQIFLETELFAAGVRPCCQPGYFWYPVSAAAQIKGHQKVAGSLKLIYSQYRELQAFSQFGPIWMTIPKPV